MGKALLLFGIVVATLVVASWVRRLTLRHFEGHDQSDEVAVQSTAKLLAAIPVFVGLDVILHILGVQLASLFAAGGLLALGAGLAAKDIVANFLSGVILRVDRTIRPGDVVEVHDRWMRIEKLGLRMTSAITARGEEIMIPNATVAQSTITSLTRQNSLYRVETSIIIPYSADLANVRSTVEKTVASLEWRSSHRGPTVFLSEFTRFNVIYEVLVWIDDVEKAGHRKSDLNEALWQGLEKAGIELIAT
ncbi:MAG: mechanosensitive ion channel domain-containing protein [Thermoanaerobaculia bacterium]